MKDIKDSLGYANRQMNNYQSETGRDNLFLALARDTLDRIVSFAEQPIPELDSILLRLINLYRTSSLPEGF